MGAIANGIAYHGGFLPYCATFLTFSDYMRGSVRLASLSGLHVTYVWTHDSVGLGEDGPTHQPVEHYAALRAIPNLWFVRPGDANEAAAAWALAVERPTIAGRHARPGRARVHAPEAADAGGLAGARPRGPAARRLRAARGRGREAPADPHRDGLGAAARLRGGRAARGRRDPVARREPARAGSGSRRRTRRTGTRSCRRRSASGSRSRSASRWAGSAGSATRARSSGSTTSARAPRPARSSRSSGSRPSGSPTSAGGSSARASTAGRRRSAPAHGEPPDARPRRRRRRSHPGHRPGPRLSTAMRVAFAADHAGAAFKDELIRRLVVELGGTHELTDLGGDGSDPNDDYPDFAQALGEAVRDGRADRGILICGSGVGASVAANKIPGIRAAICHDTYSAHQGVEHDDMNVLTLGSRVIGIEPAVECSRRVPGRDVLRRATAPAPARQGAGDRGGGPLGRLTPAGSRGPRLTGAAGRRYDPRMALVDLPLDELRAYRPPLDEPADFDAFWSSTLADSRAKRSPAVVAEVDVAPGDDPGVRRDLLRVRRPADQGVAPAPRGRCPARCRRSSSTSATAADGGDRSTGWSGRRRATRTS